MTDMTQLYRARPVPRRMTQAERQYPPKPPKPENRIFCQHDIEGRCWECRHPLFCTVVATVVFSALILACAWLLLSVPEVGF